MKSKLYSRDILFILMASFFYFASPMLVAPLITGFSGSLGASAALMGTIGGLMNLCALFCRPFVGNLADRLSKYKVSFAGGLLQMIACLGYIFAVSPAMIVAARIVNGVGFACCSVCMSTWMSNMLPKEKIGSGMGLYGTMNALAMAAARHRHPRLSDHRTQGSFCPGNDFRAADRCDYPVCKRQGTSRGTRIAGKKLFFPESADL